MASVEVVREIDADPDAVRAAMADLEPFVAAGGFDETTVEGDTIHLANGVALLRIELTLEVVEDPEADLAYEHREGIFDEMVTRYVVEPHEGGSRVTATTEFALDAAFAGPLLDATVIKRQRTKELVGQLEYLEAATA